jgi:Ca2+-binding EF-hand superfamily protein
MNDFRRDLVERAFIILDKDNDGIIDSNDIKALYNAKRHPDVV